MAESNLERVRLANAAFNEKDLEGWVQWLHEDVVFEDRNPTPGEPAILHGRAELRRLTEAWFETMPDFRLELGKHHADGDAVVAQVTYRGTGGASGLETEFKMVDVSWWSDGLVTHYISGLESLEEGRRVVAEDLLPE